jgi:hypothetical protein
VDFSDPFWTSNHQWLVYGDSNLPTFDSAFIFDTMNLSTDSLGATLDRGAFS